MLEKLSVTAQSYAHLLPQDTPYRLFEGLHRLANRLEGDEITRRGTKTLYGDMLTLVEMTDNKYQQMIMKNTALQGLSHYAACYDPWDAEPHQQLFDYATHISTKEGQECARGQAISNMTRALMAAPRNAAHIARMLFTCAGQEPLEDAKAFTAGLVRLDTYTKSRDALPYYDGLFSLADFARDEKFKENLQISVIGKLSHLAENTEPDTSAVLYEKARSLAGRLANESHKKTWTEYLGARKNTRPTRLCGLWSCPHM